MMDKKFRKPRIWSNNQLRKFSNKFTGKIVNISAWKDFDKDKKRYKEYFSNADEYYISNWYSNAQGIQENIENQFFLDLESELDKNLENNFDVVFNHTCLEHIYNFNLAFKNLCKMSKSVVIIVVPFLQEQHFSQQVKDYWRFTPTAIKRMFEENNFKLSYVNFNDHKDESIYIFAIGVKKLSHFDWITNDKENKIEEIDNIAIGKKVF